MDRRREAKYQAAINMKNRDALYTLLAEDAHLTGQAFFGHKATTGQKKTLAQLWRHAGKLVTGSVSLPPIDELKSDEI